MILFRRPKAFQFTMLNTVFGAPKHILLFPTPSMTTHQLSGRDQPGETIMTSNLCMENGSLPEQKVISSEIRNLWLILSARSVHSVVKAPNKACSGQVGTRRVFRHFSRLRVFSVSTASLVPPTCH